MKLMNKQKEMLVRNLEDSGYDEMTKNNFLELCSLGKIKECIVILQRHRISLLDDLHESQKKIDALDFLLFKLRNDAGSKY